MCQKLLQTLTENFIYVGFYNHIMQCVHSLLGVNILINKSRYVIFAWCESNWRCSVYLIEITEW